MAPAEALRQIKKAVHAGAWRPDPHLLKQIARRRLALTDVVEAVSNAHRIEPHDMLPLNKSGVSWRVYGNDTDERELGVGVELVVDDQFVVILTAFIKGKKP